MADLALAGDPDAPQVPDPDSVAVPTASPGPALHTGAAAAAEVEPDSSIVLGAAAALLTAAVLLLLARAARRSRGRLDGGSRRRIRDRLLALRSVTPEGPSAAPPGG